MKSIEATSWIENWLDNVGERGYQSAFVAALLRAGYAIVHNTSHNSLELGKDVIAKSSEGRWFAFQLKGNPSGRFTMSQWHSHFPQINQLCHMPIRDIVGATAITRFTPVLVTNGEVEEDVQAAVDLYNRRGRGPAADKLQVWSRGRLLEFFRDGSNAIWPHSPQAQIELLKATVRDYRDSPDIEGFQKLVDGILGWGGGKISKGNAISRIILCYMATNIYTSSYQQMGNLYESLKVKVFSFVRIVSYSESLSLKGTDIDAILSLIRSEIAVETRSFSGSVARKYNKAPPINDDFLSEFPIFHIRRLLCQAICALAKLEFGDQLEPEVEQWAFRRLDYPAFSHEAIVPAFLAIFWAKERYVPDRSSEYELINLLFTVLHASKNGQSFSPYHTYEEVLKNKYKAFLGRIWDEMDMEDAKRRSYFALSLFYLVAKRNWKRTCKIAWIDITETINTEFRWEKDENFSDFRTEEGVNDDFFVEYPKTWQEVISSLRQREALVSKVPRKIIDDEFIAIMYLVFFPHRAVTDVVLYLDRRITQTWY